MSSILQFIVLQILPRTSMVTGSSLPICARALVLIPAFNRSSVRFIPFSISIIHIFLYDQAILHTSHSLILGIITSNALYVNLGISLNLKIYLILRYYIFTKDILRDILCSENKITAAAESWRSLQPAQVIAHLHNGSLRTVWGYYNQDAPVLQVDMCIRFICHIYFDAV